MNNALISPKTGKPYRKQTELQALAGQINWLQYQLLGSRSIDVCYERVRRQILKLRKEEKITPEAAEAIANMHFTMVTLSRTRDRFIDETIKLAKMDKKPK